MDAKAQEVLTNYQKDVERWRASGATHYRDIQPLSVNDVLFIRTVLHPTNKADSKKVTEELINFMCERDVMTAQDVYEALGLSDKPVLKRLKIFQQFGLVRRESKKYYLPTPRMRELQKKYLKRICN